jgi:type I restriction enzyme R subunit
MTIQPEQILEDNLVKQLTNLGYNYVVINDEAALLANLKVQLESHNKTSFSKNEFDKILNHLNKGNVFERGKILRDKMQLTKDNGESIYIEFIQCDQWCRNVYQVTRQVSVEGSYKNRYDVTILINGLPLVQVELKRRGLELKEAFNQVNRYQRHSYWSANGLFMYVQIFVISNGVNTKYFANNRHQTFKQTFYWTDTHNKPITQLSDFAEEFLEACHLSKMITKYIVLNEAQKIPMVLRPYQFYAVEAILDRVKNSTKNGYIWHTTGSGKTLTSFKTSQVLIELPKVHKVVFVVDRKDLDDQTYKEFDAFSKGSVDSTEDTKMLVRQFNDDTKLILTTIQKLNNAISNKRYLEKMESQKDKPVIFIFDECHRTQFGETHNRIKSFFTGAQMFGFTGTPIFVDNAVKNEQGKRTTKELFDDCLHRYVITDAIRDENVLKFSIEYIGRYKEKTGSKTNIDIEVEDIDKKELLDSPLRLEKITDYIIANHGRKTHNQAFTGMFCVSSIDNLVTYYNMFKKRKEEGAHNLKIATIFSYTPNEDDKDANGSIPEENFSMAADSTAAFGESSHSRDILEGFIADYNKMFNSKYTTKDSRLFYDYYRNIAKRVKNKDIDILLVVNMFLTGFDSHPLNTLYVDKNLKYHGLLQAYSRTNRTADEKKSQGNIVCFRNLKKATDDAIALFANKDAQETIIIEPYEDYTKKFSMAFADLLKIAPTVNSVNDLKDENEELAFIQAFRELMRLKNILTTFADFTWNDLSMSEQSFTDYTSKYMDLHDKARRDSQTEKVSILNDVDFELELIHRDEINVAYILKLLAKLKGAKGGDKDKQRKNIYDLLSGNIKLRSKRELIEKFIEENLPNIDDPEDISEMFEAFWNEEQLKAIAELCRTEDLIPEKLSIIIENYMFTGKKPLRDEVLGMIKGAKPGVLERKTVSERIISKLETFVETFLTGMDY